MVEPNSDTRIAAVYRVLSEVSDPEIPVLTVQDMGIVRDVQFRGDEVDVTITPTYSGCPAMDTIEADIRSALEKAGYASIRVSTSLDPPWTTDWMSEDGKRKLREYGIAPPENTSGDKRTLFGKTPVVKCPHCGSEETDVISMFGSTACKALYKCRSCLEPFDYFKCI